MSSIQIFGTYLQFLVCFESIVLLAGILANIGLFMLLNTFFLCKEKDARAKVIIAVSIFSQLFMFGAVLSTPLLLKAAKEGKFGVPPPGASAPQIQLFFATLSGNLATSSPAFRLGSYLLLGVAFSLFHRAVFKKVSGARDVSLYIIGCLALACAPIMELVALSGGPLGPNVLVLGGTNIMAGIVYFIFAVMTFTSVRALKVKLELENSPVLSQLTNKLPKDKLTQVGFFLPQFLIGACISHIIAGAGVYSPFTVLLPGGTNKIAGEVLDFFFFMCNMTVLMALTWYAHIIPIVNTTGFDGSIVTGFTSDSKGDAKV